MKIVIEAEPKEIAALVLAVQERREVVDVNQIISIVTDFVAEAADSRLQFSDIPVK